MIFCSCYFLLLKSHSPSSCSQVQVCHLSVTGDVVTQIMSSLLTWLHCSLYWGYRFMARLLLDSSTSMQAGLTCGFNLSYFPRAGLLPNCSLFMPIFSFGVDPFPCRFKPSIGAQHVPLDWAANTNICALLSGTLKGSELSWRRCCHFCFLLRQMNNGKDL